MIIRYLKPDDAEQSAKISSSSFIWPIDKDEVASTKKEIEGEKHKKILGAFLDDDKTLMAQIEIFHFKNNFCGKYLKSSGIGGVCTAPKYRNSGAVRSLFEAHFKNVKEEGFVLSSLYPFSYNFYRLFGYESICRFASCTIPFKAISHINKNYDVELYERDEQMMEQLLNIYDEYAKGHTFMFQRTNDERFFHKAYELNEYTYIWYDESKNPNAYISYTCHRPSSTINVKEIIYKNYESLCGVLGFLRSYEGNFEKIHFMRLPMDSPIFNVITEHKLCKSEIIHSGAVKILDMEAVLKANTYPKEYGKFSLFYPDDCVNGSTIFDVEYENADGKVKMRKEGDYDISLLSAPAARLILGGEGISSEQLEYLKGIEVKTCAKDFLRAFPARPVDYYEGF